MLPSIGMIVPSYNNMGYLRRTISSFYKYSPNVQFIVVDDHSTEWDFEWQDKNPEADITLHRFEDNGGLTRSWNKGFDIIRDMDDPPEYTIFGNNDILATNGWWRGMVGELNSGYDLAGPLSNAAGITAAGKQDIANYVDNYKLTDDPSYNDKVADELWVRYGKKHTSMPVPAVNGFFMMAKTATIAQNCLNTGNVFVPVLNKMPSGRTNPTPLMTGNEDDLQNRWRQRMLKSTIALGSYIFHYRSVARGRKYAKAGWFRCNDLDKPV